MGLVLCACSDAFFRKKMLNWALLRLLSIGYAGGKFFFLFHFHKFHQKMTFLNQVLTILKCSLILKNVKKAW